MTLHVMDTTMHEATETNIFSPDADVFILLQRRYPELCQNVNFATGIGQWHRVVKLQPIAQALSKTKISALPALHVVLISLETSQTKGSLHGGTYLRMLTRRPLLPSQTLAQENRQKQAPWMPLRDSFVRFISQALLLTKSNI